MGLVSLRKEVSWLRENFGASQQRACGLLAIAVSSCRYQSRRSDAGLREQLVELARLKPRWGYRRLHILLDGRGTHVNHKRVFRVYREAGLPVRRKARKRLVREGSPRPALTAANQEWGMDFVQDVTASGRTIRVLAVSISRTVESSITLLFATFT